MILRTISPTVVRDEALQSVKDHILIDRGRWERVRRAAEASFVVYDWDNDAARAEAEDAWQALETGDLSPAATDDCAGESLRGMRRDVGASSFEWGWEQG